MRGMFLVAALTACWASALAENRYYQPWDTVGIATGADLNIPVPLDGERRSWRSWDSSGQLRWGWTEAERTGDWRSWDNERGYRWGRIEVED